MTRPSPLLSRHVPNLGFAALLLASLAGRVASQQAEPQIELGERNVPLGASIVSGGAQGDQKWLRCRVVDAIHGKPIPAAEVLLIAERSTPITGEFHYEMQAEADEHGFVELRCDEGAEGYRPWGWVMVRADGYCATMAHQALDESVIRLTPAVPLRLQVRDWRDRPVAGALVGHCDGCGHTPDLASGTTGPDGEVTLPGVDTWRGASDNYILHPDLGLGYTGNTWRPGSRPLVLSVPPGKAVEGVVYDHLGKPVAGAAVGMPTVHRGPWTKTAADGSFRLLGLDGASDLQVRHEDHRYIFGCDAVQGVCLELPELAADAAKVPGASTVINITRGEAARRRAEQQWDERVRLAELREQAWPKVIVRTVGLPADGSAVLRTRGRKWDLEDAIATGEGVGLPDEEFVFWLGHKSEERCIAVDRTAAIRDGVVRLHWYPPTLLEGRVIDEQGNPLQSELAILDGPVDGPAGSSVVPCDGAFALPVVRSGTAWLWIKSRFSEGRRIVPIELPPRGDDAFLDVGTIRLLDDAATTFQAADGSPLAGGSVRVIRAGWCDVDRGWKFDLDDRGQAWLPDLRLGDALIVRGQQVKAAAAGGGGAHPPIDLPTRVVVGERAPQVVRMHAGQIRFEVDADGATSFVSIADRVVPLRPGGATLVRGVAAGEQFLAVGAAGRRSALVMLEVLARNDPATVQLSLPAVGDAR
ncbi:MAG: hypothetical protein AB8H80_02775 [Planctomycetota bacterium]